MAGRIITSLLRQFRYKGLLRRFRYEGTGVGEISLRSKLLIAVLIISLLVVYYISGMDYINQRREHEALAFQIATTTQALAQMSDPPQSLENLEERLEVAREELAAERSIFPRQLNSTEVVSAILGLANSLRINAIPLITQAWSIEVVGENTYGVLRLTVTAEGSFSQLVNFVSRLENGEYQTLIVEDLTVDRVTLLSEENGSEGAILFIASFNLAIYAQSLTSD